jgi:DNA-directed RNA polymerase subunit RPC12/RpoP
MAWEFIIDNDKNFCQKCPECGVKLYFKNKITVHQVIEK